MTRDTKKHTHRMVYDSSNKGPLITSSETRGPLGKDKLKINIKVTLDMKGVKMLTPFLF